MVDGADAEAWHASIGTQSTASTMFGRILQSSFLKAVVLVSSGQILGAVIQIAAAPILGRLYTPVDYGALGGYIAVATVLVAIGNWQISQGIIVERSSNKAASLVHACKWATLATTLVATALAAILVALSYLTNRDSVLWWYLLLPLSTFVGGSSATLASLANRQGVYRRMAVVLAVPVAISVCLSLAMGWLGWGSTGLFLSYFAGQIATLVLYSMMVPRLPERSSTASSRRVRTMLHKYRRFAFYTTPTTFISSFTMNAPVYALTALGATSMVGSFTRANQLLNLPAQLIGASIAQVFQRRAAKEYHESGHCWRIYRRTLLALVALGAIPTILLALFAPLLFAWFLGPNWTDAGRLARILAPVLLLRVVCSPLSTVFYIAGKQREDFILSLCMSCTTLACIACSLAYREIDLAVVIGFAVGQCLMYTLYLIASARYARPTSMGRVN